MVTHDETKNEYKRPCSIAVPFVLYVGNLDFADGPRQFSSAPGLTSLLSWSEGQDEREKTLPEFLALVYGFPVVVGHDASHEAVKTVVPVKRCVTMAGTPDHSFGDKLAADGSQRRHSAPPVRQR